MIGYTPRGMQVAQETIVSFFYSGVSVLVLLFPISLLQIGNGFCLEFTGHFLRCRLQLGVCIS
jgi:hypothetical protein